MMSEEGGPARRVAAAEQRFVVQLPRGAQLQAKFPGQRFPQERRGGVVHLPQAQAHRPAARQQERLGEAEKTIATALPPQAALAGR